MQLKTTPAARSRVPGRALILLLPALVMIGCRKQDAPPEAQRHERPTGGPTEAAELDPMARFEAMMLRYTPGPHVVVEGGLPREEVRGSVFAWMSREGRTIDTPWLVLNGQLLAHRAPDTSLSSRGPGLELRRDGIQTIIAGVPNALALRVSDPDGLTDIVGFHIAFQDYLGHFYVPAMIGGEVMPEDPSDPGAISLHFGVETPQRPDGSLATHEPFQTTMYVAAIDRARNVSQYVTQQLQVTPLGTGDVEVTLTMSQATDLDLYVREPSGAVVYYGNERVANGGQLDLDANAACDSNMGINNEHIFWPAGAAPAGSYDVMVAHYESCVGGAPVDYTVTVENCGETVVFAGRFAGGGDAEACMHPSNLDSRPEWCQHVVKFQVDPCEDLQ